MKKLILNKRTISNLSEKEMRNVKGGETTIGIQATGNCPNSGISTAWTNTCPNSMTYPIKLTYTCPN